MQSNMLAMILAGGRGSRLKDLTNKVAKPNFVILLIRSTSFCYFYFGLTSTPHY